MNKIYDVIFVGAGLFGMHSALELSDYLPKLKIGIIEKNDDVIKGASGNNTGRVHLGYHYPRDFETALQSYQNYDLFLKYYQESIITKFPNYYFIVDSPKSLTTKNQYLNFLENINLPFITLDLKDITRLGMNPKDISLGIQTEESVCDLAVLKQKIKEKLRSNMEVYLNEEVIDVIKKSGRIVVKSTKQIYETQMLVFSNYMQPIGTVLKGNKEFYSENTEILEIELVHKPYGITLLDGPFISLLPFGKNKNRFSLYSVIYSRFKSKPQSLKIISEGIKYLPILKNAKIIRSLYSLRSLEKNVGETDRRLSKLIKLDDNFFMIQSGKLDHVFDISESIKLEVTKIFGNH